MGSSALKVEFHRVDTHCAAAEDLVGFAGVESDAHIKAIESAAAGHKGLAGQNFLCGAAVEHHSCLLYTSEP